MRHLLLTGLLTATAFVPTLPAAHPDDDRPLDRQDRRGVVPPPPTRPNVLLVILDDVGVDMIPAYGEGPGTPPCTPNLDALAASGVLFRNAWTNPLCSPSRAQLMTGRHAFRTGVGSAVNGQDPPTSAGLSHEEETLPEVLRAQGYSTALFGKWHLGTDNEDPADPNLQGFDWYEGSIGGSVGHIEQPGPSGQGCPDCPPGCQTGTLGYTKWVKSTNGIETCDTRYATTANVDDALGAIGSMVTEPWFVTLSFNAIHSPFHRAPVNLCPNLPGCVCVAPGPDPGDKERAKTMLEALDTELGRFLSTLDSLNPAPTWVFLIGDNGTPPEVAEGSPGSCFASNRSKNSLYEGGINVPLIVSGPGVVPGERDALVSSTDLFATIVELCLAKRTAEDSVSFAPNLFGFTGSLRETVYAESFIPNGLPFQPTNHARTIRDSRFKLVKETGEIDQLYDLLADPCETVNLYPATIGTPEHVAWLLLTEELNGMN